MHGECSVEVGWAVVGEVAPALAVDDRVDVVDVVLVEDIEAGASGEPAAPGAVLVLDLAALPWRVRVAEPDVDAVGRGEGFPLGSLRALLEGDRARHGGGDAIEPFDEPSERRERVVTLGHRDRERVAGDTLGEGDQRRLVAGPDDLVNLPVADLEAIVDLGRSGGDVGQSGPTLVGVAGLSGPASWPATAEALGGLHAEHTAVDGLVGRLDARQRRGRLGAQVRPDCFRRPPLAQLRGDALTQLHRHRREPIPATPSCSLSSAFCTRWAVLRRAAVALDLAGHGRGMTVDPPDDRPPRRLSVLGQREGDLLAFGQRQRRAWHPVVSNGRSRSTAPVIMTGTVHRPLEPAGHLALIVHVKSGRGGLPML